MIIINKYFEPIIMSKYEKKKDVREYFLALKQYSWMFTFT